MEISIHSIHKPLQSPETGPKSMAASFNAASMSKPFALLHCKNNNWQQLSMKDNRIELVRTHALCCVLFPRLIHTS